jgi:hypothetical protein
VKLDDNMIPFRVWRQTEAEADAQMFHAFSAKHAAEKRARQDWTDHGEASWPITYNVQDGVNGNLWSIDVAIATQPSFVAIDARQIEMAAAVHVLWGGHVLCEDLRLRAVPRDWPESQRWVSLKDVAENIEVSEDLRCPVCWGKVFKLIEELRQIGKVER